MATTLRELLDSLGHPTWMFTPSVYPFLDKQLITTTNESIISGIEDDDNIYLEVE